MGEFGVKVELNALFPACFSHKHDPKPLVPYYNLSHHRLQKMLKHNG